MIDLRQLFAGLGGGQQSFPFGGPGGQMQPTATAPVAPLPRPPGAWGTPPVPGAPPLPESAPLPPARPMLADNPAGDPNALTPAFSPGGPVAEMQGPPMPPGLQANATQGPAVQGPPAPAAAPSMMDKLMADKDFGVDMGNLAKGIGGGGGGVEPPAAPGGVGATGNDAGRASAAQLFQAILAAHRPRATKAAQRPAGIF